MNIQILSTLPKVSLVALVVATSILRSAVAQAEDRALAESDAIRLLLAMSNEAIPKTSTCFADYGQKGKVTVKDILATQLGSFPDGENFIRAGCINGSCVVSLRHSHGEDVSSAEIRFLIRKERGVAASMECTMTP